MIRPLVGSHVVVVLLASPAVLATPIDFVPHGSRGPSATNHHVVSTDPGGSSQSSRGTLILRNAQWERVQFEVRVGPSIDCDANPRVRLRTLRQNQGWVFITADVVCWRRERVPGDAAQGWTLWQQARVPAGTRQEVEL